VVLIVLNHVVWQSWIVRLPTMNLKHLTPNPPTRVLLLSILSLKLDRLAVYLHLPRKPLSRHCGAMPPTPTLITYKMSYEIMPAPSIQFETSSDG